MAARPLTTFARRRRQEGQLYYFFDSKAELAAEALEASWVDRRVELDGIFSATVPPLERLEKYCDFTYKISVKSKQNTAAVLGCPQASLGSEICTQEDALQEKIQGIMEQNAGISNPPSRCPCAGLIHAPDPGAKARMIFAYYEGLLAQARIPERCRSIA